MNTALKMKDETSNMTIAVILVYLLSLLSMCIVGNGMVVVLVAIYTRTFCTCSRIVDMRNTGRRFKIDDLVIHLGPIDHQKR